MTNEPDKASKPTRAAYADGPRLLADIGATHARFALRDRARRASATCAVLLCDDFPASCRC